MFARVDQGQFIKKIEAYLQGHGRGNLLISKKTANTATINGLCNGASLWLFERLFYDCLNRHYQTSLPIQNLLDKVIEDFFKEIEFIVNTDDALLNSQDHQQKLANRMLGNYTQAKHKLDASLANGQLKISSATREKYEKFFKSSYVYNGTEQLASLTIDKPQAYFLMLLDLAENQAILTSEESAILRSAYIPEIPEFERFINQVFLLQTPLKEFIFSQDDVAEKFAQLTANNEGKEPLPLPILDHIQSFIITPEELLFYLSNIIPDKRLAYIWLPQHAVLAFRISNQLYFYDPNNERKELIICNSELIFVLKLALSELLLALDDEKLKHISSAQINKLYIDYRHALNNYLSFNSEEDINSYIAKSREWLSQSPESMLIQATLLKTTIAQFEKMDQANEDGDAFIEALALLPKTIGFTMMVYRHGSSPENTYLTDDELFSDLDLKEIMYRTDVAHETFLMKYAKSKQHAALQTFLDKLKNFSPEDQERLVNSVDKEGITALHRTCYTDSTDMATCLLKCGAKPNLADKDGILPLSLAIYNGNIPMIQTLLDHGADVDLEFTDAFSPFKIICRSTVIAPEIFDCLLPYTRLNKPTDTTPPLFLCIMNKHYAYIKKLLEKGANPNFRVVSFHTPFSQLAENFIGYSALEYAILRNDLESVILLLRYGASLNKNEKHNFARYRTDKKIELFLQFPLMAKGETKAEQLSLLFRDYVCPPIRFNIFPTTWRHYKTYAERISHELQEPKNRNLDDTEIKTIIDQILENIPGGYHSLRDGEFKNRVYSVFNYFLEIGTTTDQLNARFQKRPASLAKP